MTLKFDFMKPATPIVEKLGTREYTFHSSDDAINQSRR